MRLLRSIMLTATMIVLGGVSVFAGTTEFAVDEIGVKFQVQEELLGYTRTSDISQDVMNALGYSTEDYKEHLVEKMEEENKYYIGFDANVSYQVSLKSVESSVDTYTTKTDDEVLQQIDAGLEGELTQYGVEVTEKSVFTEQERKYAVVGLSDTTGHCYLYATVEDNKAYYFYIRSYGGAINDAHKALIKQIAGSSEFYEAKEVVASNNSSSDKDVAEDTSSETQESGTNFISVVIDIAKYVAFIVLVLVLIIILVSKITKGGKSSRGNKRSRSRGKKKKEINYGTRRDVAYQERLRRVMGVDDASTQPKPQEAQLEAADDGVKLEEFDI